MKKIFLISVLICFATISIAQSIKLLASKTGNDLVVVSNDYFIYFPIKDIKRTISLLPDNKRKAYLDITKHMSANATFVIKGNENVSFVAVFDQDISAFLLSQGRAYIENKDKKRLTSISWEEAPTQIDLNGNKSPKTILFSDNSTEILLGSISADLENKKL